MMQEVQKSKTELSNVVIRLALRAPLTVAQRGAYNVKLY